MANGKPTSSAELYPKISTTLTGIAGEYFVAAELSRRGLIACMTVRNTRGVDILVSNGALTRTVSIQVKTNQKFRKKWLFSEGAESLKHRNFFYVLVNLQTESGLPDFHIVPSKVVAETISKEHREWLAAKGRGGRTRNATSVRVFRDLEDRYKSKWKLFGFKGLE